MKAKHPIALLAALTLTASGANAYIYDVGPNYVNMAGSSCRAPTSGSEAHLYHDNGFTAVKSSTSYQNVLCPIARRGTSFYGGQRLDDSVPVAVQNTQFRVNIGVVMLRGTDASSSRKFTCHIFGSRLSDDALYYGTTKALCASAFGCSTGSITNGWTGENTMVLNPPSALSSIDTVNFGVSCSLPSNSTIYYTETSITPN